MNVLCLDMGPGISIFREKSLGDNLNPRGLTVEDGEYSVLRAAGEVVLMGLLEGMTRCVSQTSPALPRADWKLEGLGVGPE